MNLTDIGVRGASVASLLHLCSKNATAELRFFRPHSHARTQLNDALTAFQHEVPGKDQQNRREAEEKIDGTKQYRGKDGRFIRSAMGMPRPDED